MNVANTRENGPISIHANITLEGQGKMLRATLCRCGASKNKPFCDSSHHEINFQATGEPATQESKSLEARGGELKIISSHGKGTKITVVLPCNGETMS